MVAKQLNLRLVVVHLNWRINDNCCIIINLIFYITFYVHIYTIHA